MENGKWKVENSKGGSHTLIFSIFHFPFSFLPFLPFSIYHFVNLVYYAYENVLKPGCSQKNTVKCVFLLVFGAICVFFRHKHKNEAVYDEHNDPA